MIADPPRKYRKRKPAKREVTPRMMRANAKNAPKGGGKPMYRVEFCRVAEAMALRGANDTEIAKTLGVAESTVRTWKDAHYPFADAIRNGREGADEKVAKALFRRAVGYKHKAVKIFMPANAVAPVYADYIERYAPDTAAALAWLERRAKGQWLPPALALKLGGDPDNLTPVGVVIVPAKAP